MYNQISTSGCHVKNDKNIFNTIQFCKKNIEGPRGIELAGKCKKRFEENYQVKQ